MSCHRECTNFAPVDVAKGICHRQKLMVVADDACCEHFELKPRCRHCRNFKAEAARVELGTCTATPAGLPVFMVYPDLVAVTCEKFQTT